MVTAQTPAGLAVPVEAVVPAVRIARDAAVAGWGRGTAAGSVGCAAPDQGEHRMVPEWRVDRG